MTTEILTLQSDVARERAAVRLGFGDMIKLAKMELKLKRLVDAENEEHHANWEAYMAAYRRTFPEPKPTMKQASYLMALGLEPMGMDETREECERRVSRAEHYGEDR